MYNLPPVPPLPTAPDAKDAAHSEEWIATLRAACEKLATEQTILLTAPQNLPVSGYLAFWAEVAANLPSGLRLSSTGYRDCGATRHLLRA